MATPTRKPAPKTATAKPAGPTIEATVEANMEEAAAAPVEVMEAAAEQLAGMREMARKLAESNIAQTRAAYDRMKSAAEEATATMEDAYATATKNVTEFNNRAIDAMKSNADSTFEFMKSLSGAKTFADVLALQSEHSRKQLQAFGAQTQELARLAQELSAKSVAPVTSAFSKTFGMQQA